TSTNFAISTISNSLLKTLSNGAVVAAVAGTDYQAPGNYATFAYPFPGNATTTALSFNGGATISSLTLGTALTVANGGTGSTTLGGLLTGNGTGALTSAAVTAPLTFTGNTLAINQATLSTSGFLSSTDFNTFNNKISSTSLSAVYPLAYNSSTGAFTTA